MRARLGLVLLVALISACFPTRSSITVGLRFGFELSPVITRFEPDQMKFLFYPHYFVG